MTERGRELLPPEEATSWDEFQDRWVIERARYQETGRSWRETGRLWLSVLPGLAAVVLWVAFALTDQGVRWLLLALALICTALFGWALGGVLQRRWRRARKRRDLDRVRDQWHERSERGDLPRTSPGGSKVWRDEIPVEVPEDKRTSLSKQRREPDHPERLAPDRRSISGSELTDAESGLIRTRRQLYAFPTGRSAAPGRLPAGRLAVPPHRPGGPTWTAKRTPGRPSVSPRRACARVG
jgi:hypothetical protein